MMSCPGRGRLPCHASCSPVGSKVQERRHRYVRRTTIRVQVVLLVTRVGFQSKHRLVALVGGPLPPHDTTNDSSFTTNTRQLPPVCNREPRSESASLAKSIASYSIMASSPNHSTPSAVGAPSLNSYLSPYQVHNTKLHTLLVLCITILRNNTCKLPFYYASIYVRPLRARPTAARTTKWCGRRSRYGKSCCLIRMYSYITVRKIPTVSIPGTRYFVMGIDF